MEIVNRDEVRTENARLELTFKILMVKFNGFLLREDLWRLHKIAFSKNRLMVYMKTTFIILLIFPIHAMLSQPVVYPLHVGNRWQYDIFGWGPVSCLRIEKDTLMTNGQHYARIFYDATTFGYYERQVGNKVFRYNTQTQNEDLWYDFSLSPGDTVNSIPNGSDTTDIFFSYYHVDTLFGTNRRQWGFWIDHARHFIDDEQAIEITDSLGITDMTMCFGFSTLRGAIINGITYGTVTNVKTNPKPFPSRFQLQQNYPNPFNPQTKISYSVPKESFITLKVYDVLGREVATLVQDKKQVGEYTVTWNADNVPSGVYFYKLTSNGFTETKKMLFIR